MNLVGTFNTQHLAPPYRQLAVLVLLTHGRSDSGTRENTQDDEDIPASSCNPDRLLKMPATVAAHYYAVLQLSFNCRQHFWGFFSGWLRTQAGLRHHERSKIFTRLPARALIAVSVKLVRAQSLCRWNAVRRLRDKTTVLV